jgi:LmbE family N-acetylglucosaminyl deacetylase
MVTFKLQGVKRLLCLGAHSDDIEIGAGAAILRLIRENPGLEIHWAVFTAKGVRASEARNSAADFLAGVRKRKVHVGRFRESFFPADWTGIKEALEKIKRSFEPDLVLTHYRDDRHQDHRVLSDLAWNTFRNHLVLEFEIPKFDGDLGIPNVFIPVTRADCDRKIATLLRRFKSQATRHWFTDDTFRALLRLRGIESASPTGYAEAFYGRKIVI